MTEAQIKLLISFRKEIVAIKGNKGLVQKGYYNSLFSLNNKIKSALPDEYKPANNLFVNARILDTEKTLAITQEHYTYDDDELDKCADVMLATIDGIIAKIPNYEYICQVREDIKTAKNSSIKKRKAVILELVAKYSGIIKIDKSVSDLIKQKDYLPIEPDYLSAILKGIIGRLELHLSTISTAKPKGKSSSNTTNINLTQTQNNSQVQSITFDVNVSIQNCKKDLDDCETLSNAETKLLKDQLDELQQLYNSKRGNKKTIREKISSMLKWIAEKGTDVMIAILPAITQILCNLR